MINISILHDFTIKIYVISGTHISYTTPYHPSLPIPLFEKDVRVTFDENLIFECHIAEKVEKAN